jgi:hypothetical protein
MYDHSYKTSELGPWKLSVVKPKICYRPYISCASRWRLRVLRHFTFAKRSILYQPNSLQLWLRFLSYGL